MQASAKDKGVYTNGNNCMDKVEFKNFAVEQTVTSSVSAAEGSGACKWMKQPGQGFYL